MDVFLTGATGFLGSHVAKELDRRGHSLIALARSTSQADHLSEMGAEIIWGSLPELGPLSQVLSRVDAVIHIAGALKALSKKDFITVNSLGTARLVEEIRKASPTPKTFLQISSIAACNPKEANDYCLPPENYRSLSHYGESKRQGELALNHLPPTTRSMTLRPPVLYGPGDYELLPLFKAIRRGIAPLFRDGATKLSICYGPDVARAIADLIESDEDTKGHFCLDDGRVHTWRGLSESIAQALDKRPRYLKTPSTAFYLAALFSQLKAQITRRPEIFTLNKMREITQDQWVCGHEKLTQATGWKPTVEINEGMAQTFRYYQQTGLI